MAISLPSAEYLDSNESLVLKVGEEVVKIYPLSLGPKLTHYGRITEQSAQQFNGLEVTLPINYRPSSFRLKIVPIQKVQSQPEEIEIPRLPNLHLPDARPGDTGVTFSLFRPYTVSRFIEGPNLLDIESQEVDNARTKDEIKQAFLDISQRTKGINHLSELMSNALKQPIILSPLNLKPRGKELLVTDVCSVVDFIKTHSQ